ncbi:MAG: hypothetical protein H7833_12245 [Magnetococcus sp. DMHC-1]
MHNRPNNRPNKIVMFVFTFFKLCIFSIWLNTTIQIIDFADYPYIIKDSEACMENREYLEICEHGGSKCNDNEVYSLFIMLCIYMYFFSLIIYPIIVYKIKGWERKIFWAATGLIPFLSYILIYDINESVYYKWPKEKAIQEELLKDPAKNAINYWSYCDARIGDLGYAENEKCKEVLAIIEYYKNIN